MVMSWAGSVHSVAGCAVSFATGLRSTATWRVTVEVQPFLSVTVRVTKAVPLVPGGKLKLGVGVLAPASVPEVVDQLQPVMLAPGSPGAEAVPSRWKTKPWLVPTHCAAGSSTLNVAAGL